MLEIDNFKKLYCYHPIEKDDNICIDENKGEANIRHLNIYGKGIHFTSFEECYSSKIGSLFLKQSSCTKNADGVILFEDNENKKIVLCEMKSSAKGVFSSAYQQAFSSYIKTCMLLSVCEGFNIDNYNVFFLFTAQRGADLDMIRNELEEIENRDPYDEFGLSLLKGEKVRVEMSKTPHNVSFLHSKYINKEVVCQLLTTDNDTVNIDITSYPNILEF